MLCCQFKWLNTVLIYLVVILKGNRDCTLRKSFWVFFSQHFKTSLTGYETTVSQKKFPPKSGKIWCVCLIEKAFQFSVVSCEFKRKIYISALPWLSSVLGPGDWVKKELFFLSAVKMCYFSPFPGLPLHRACSGQIMVKFKHMRVYN